MLNKLKGIENYINESLNEAVYVPSNIMEFAQRNGSFAVSLVKKVATWADKSGKFIHGGTAIGKNYSTIVLDIKGRDSSDVYINLDNETIKLFGTEVTDAKSFKKVWDENSKTNESLNEGFDPADVKRTVDLIKKKIGSNPGYFFLADEDEVDAFDKLWNRSKYQDALDMLASTQEYANLESDDYDGIVAYIKMNESLNEAKLNVSDKKGTAKLFADVLKKFGVDVNDVRIEDKNTIVIDFRDIRVFTPKNREPIANAINELIDKSGRELEMVDWMDEEEDDDRTFPSYIMLVIKE